MANPIKCTLLEKKPTLVETATSATKLATSRTIITDLDSTSVESFNGTADIRPGVTGTLNIGNGGTNASTAEEALGNLGGVPLTRTVNKKALSEDVSLNISDVGGSNPNLLDNWYFPDPIDQRQGYIVKSDVNYYSDVMLGTVAGVTTETMRAQYIDATHGSIIIDGATYYVATADMVRGYISDTPKEAYAIDRWLTGGGLDFEVTSDGISISLARETGYRFIAQRLESNRQLQLRGRQVTLSALVKGNGSINLGAVNHSAIKTFSVSSDKYELFSNTFIWTSGNNKWLNTPEFTINEGQVTIKAIKLESGSVQTLAHQDAAGAWVLNDPPPDKALELEKCQRYQVFGPLDGFERHGTNAGRSVAASFPIPTRIRANPTFVGDIMCQFGLDTYYFNTTNSGIETINYGNKIFTRITPRDSNLNIDFTKISNILINEGNGFNSNL